MPVFPCPYDRFQIWYFHASPKNQILLHTSMSWVNPCWYSYRFLCNPNIIWGLCSERSDWWINLRKELNQKESNCSKDERWTQDEPSTSGNQVWHRKWTCSLQPNVNVMPTEGFWCFVHKVSPLSFPSARRRLGSMRNSGISERRQSLSHSWKMEMKEVMVDLAEYWVLKLYFINHRRRLRQSI